jgi:hypothetical protein
MERQPQRGDRRKLKHLWVGKRKECRAALKIYTILFSMVLIATPLLVLGDTPAPAAENDGGVFGLHPELIKLAFYLLFGLTIFLLNKTLRRIDQNQAILYSNQRELTRVLTQLTTAHSLNHGQPIEAPRLAGAGE